MKKLTVFLLVFVVLLAFVVPAQAQFKVVEKFEYTQGWSDSTTAADFSTVYYFKRPETFYDTLNQLVMYINSATGTPHLAISYKYAFYLGGNTGSSTSYKVAANDSVLSADFSSEGVFTWSINPHADDDCINSGSEAGHYNAIAVTIAGTTANEVDTEFHLYVISKVLYEKTKKSKF